MRRRAGRSRSLSPLRMLPILALLALHTSTFLLAPLQASAAAAHRAHVGSSAPTLLLQGGKEPSRPKRSRTTSQAAASGGPSGTALLLAALSSLLNGTFPACARLPSGPPLDPVLFNGLVCVGVFLSSLLLPAFAGTPLLFTVGGLAGGVLFVFAALFSFVAIPRAGLATAQAVWSCSAIVVSFTWGAFGPSQVSEPVRNLPLSFAAVLLLVIGALIIVNCELIAGNLGGTDGPQDEAKSSSDRAAGIACALAVGLFGGSVLVPFKFVPPEAAGLNAVPSFGLGALVAGALVTAGYWVGVKKESELPAVPLDALLAGLASGTLWNAGNVCSIIAQSPPLSLPYGVAYPILQCALFFGGLLGIYVFKEIQGLAVSVFWAGAVALVAGIVALSSFGPGA